MMMRVKHLSCSFYRFNPVAFQDLDEKFFHHFKTLDKILLIRVQGFSHGNAFFDCIIDQKKIFYQGFLAIFDDFMALSLHPLFHVVKLGMCP